MSSIVSLAFSVIGEVCRVMEKDKERHQKLYSGLRYIKQEMEMVTTLMKDMKCRGAVQEIRIQQLQVLAYDVQDFVEGLWKPGAYGKILISPIKVATGSDPRSAQLIEIEEFEKRIKSLAKEWKENAESSQGEDTDHGAMPEPDPDGDAEEQLVGIEGPKSKIVELLTPSPAEEQQLRVISIVGCRGVGKTAVAKALYKEYSSTNAFECVAWVVASGCNNKKTLLDKILKCVLEDLASRASRTENAQTETDGAFTTNPNLRDILSDKRCLVFVDDMQQVEVWKDTVDACRKNGSKSRIVATTSAHSVATACSSGSYVYNMQCLSDNDSKSLFWRKVYGCQREPSHALKTDSKSIFSKCGGLPLALTSVAKHLNMKGENLESFHCKDIGKNLGKNISGTHNALSEFNGIRRALRQYYDSLPDYDHRSCMLYLSIFPKGRQIKSKTLLRKFMAEGLIISEGCKCFDELIDRCIFEPVQICNNAVVAKSCKVHAVVLEYIIQQSGAKNVVTLIQGSEPVIEGSPKAPVRRLSIQSSTKETFDDLDDKSALRSLTVIETEPSDLQGCKMLRLLDLEGCTGIEKVKGFIEGLSELPLLKYLNLRRTGISKLPPKIDKLQCLETLDIRDTKIEILSIQVIMLPKLAYLFGKFQLSDVPKGKELNKLSEFLEKKSLLHTLSGYIADKRKGPEHVILHARNLKTVKVWYRDAQAAGPTGPCVDHQAPSGSASAPDQCNRCSSRSGKTCVASQNHDSEEHRSRKIDSFKLLNKRGVKPIESVSIVSGSGICSDFLGSLEGPCTISSIKLRGYLSRLPDSTKLYDLGRINKLQLFSTGLSIKDLSALQCLRGLEYLKLVEHDMNSFRNGVFIVKENGFESLKSLCIESPEVPEMQFKDGAMKSLTTLYLLCPNSRMPSGTMVGISRLVKLSEVILHSSMQQAWETAVADGHPNRPCVKRQTDPSPTDNTAA